MKISVTTHAPVLQLVLVTVLLFQTGKLTGQEETGQKEDGESQHLKRIVEIAMTDSEVLKGRLCLPQSSNADNATPVEALIVFVHGTGPGTFLTRRQRSGRDFYYFDLFAKHFNDRGVAFFSYNKRGVTNSDQPPCGLTKLIGKSFGK